MDEDAENKRRLMRAFMARHGLKVTPWAKKAGVSRGAVNSFLEGRTRTMTLTSIEKLAAAVGAPVSEMIGEQPPTPPPSSLLPVDEEALVYAVRKVLRQHIAAKKGNLDTEDLAVLADGILEAYRRIAEEERAAANG